MYTTYQRAQSFTSLLCRSPSRQKWKYIGGLSFTAKGAIMEHFLEGSAPLSAKALVLLTLNKLDKLKNSITYLDGALPSNICLIGP